MGELKQLFVWSNGLIGHKAARRAQQNEKYHAWIAVFAGCASSPVLQRVRFVGAFTFKCAKLYTNGSRAEECVG
jgi:hypothetical protein